MLEYVDSLNDFPDTPRRIFNSVLREMIEDAIEVILDLKSQLDPGHPQRASFLASGERRFAPRVDPQDSRAFFQGIALPEARSSA